MKIAITGSNGFLGSHLVKVAVLAGHDVIALVRPGADITKLPLSRKLSIESFDYTSAESMADAMHRLQSIYGSIDALIHNAGTTVTLNPQYYFESNTQLTKQLLDVTRNTKWLAPDGTWVQISSYAAKGPEGAGHPVSAYGSSKLAAEQYVKDSAMKYIIVRPTAVYGSGDRAFLPLFQWAKWGIYPLLAPINQRITMIHAGDLAEFVIKHLGQKLSKREVHISDGQVYTHKDFKKTLESVIGRKVIFVKIPKFLINVFLRISERIALLTGHSPSMTLEKYQEITRDWHLSKYDELSHPKTTLQYNLEAGFKETYKYYQSVKLL